MGIRFYCCYLTSQAKNQLKRMEENWSLHDRFACIEFLHRAIYKDTCGECKKWYDEVKKLQQEFLTSDVWYK